MPETESQTAIRIMVFLSEDDRAGHHDLSEVLVARAHKEGLAGATVWRGAEGFGADRRVRTDRFPDALLGLPLAVEIIDRPAQVEAFLPIVKQLAPGSLVTREEVTMTRLGRESSGH